ncbi:MAG: hypothetical protein PHY34_04055 [Patescibacteria group bacterium]|nr:hypothetical protein [Patescibacteria group bacterium]MDD5715500.1 hypothetical protein [Patescibacteria group bacterium]
MEDGRLATEDPGDPESDDIGIGELIVWLFLFIVVTVVGFFRNRRYALLLLLFGTAVAFVEAQLFTNTKATYLMVIGSFGILWANYTMTVYVCEETCAEYLQSIFRQRCWWIGEVRAIGLYLSLVAACMAGIWLVWYLPKGYTVNLSGMGSAVALVVAIVLVSSYLGTRRVLQQHVTS